MVLCGGAYTHGLSTMLQGVAVMSHASFALQIEFKFPTGYWMFVLSEGVESQLVQLGTTPSATAVAVFPRHSKHGRCRC